MSETIKERKRQAVTAKYQEDPDFPREILIDITSHCDHSCAFCANSKLPKRRAMDPELVVRVLHEAYENGTRDVGLYATGEPFLVKRLPEYVALAKSIGYEYIYLTTNGATARPERAKAVIDAGLNSIKFSMHGGTRETYKAVHGKDDFDKVMANLKWVSEYRQSAGLNFRIYVTMVINDRNRHEVELLRSLVTPYIDEWDPHLLTNACGTMPENNDLGHIEPENIRGRTKSNVCFQPFKSFTVTPEGFLSACVLDYQAHLLVADLNKLSLKEAWNCPEYRRFRRLHMSGNVKDIICQNCIYNTNVPVSPLVPELTALVTRTGGEEPDA
ncbi:MAG: radical SAM protein [Magnetococcales bacterium]|nr:radical SAM protein [Magnetococcales bacterium]MBF0284132.1 radical SAM protein [Magnetococcales bacterium]